MLTIRLNGCAFEGLIDTGADVTIIQKAQWPPAWPLTPSATHLQGIGQSSPPEQSSQLVSWEDGEGHRGHIKPYVLPHIPFNLWGRDLLAQLGTVIGSPSPIVTAQMLNQGFKPEKGLGRTESGALEPISATPHSNRADLGYFS
ncbi:endogenous retrovirus group K member 7 Pro protein-like [Dasypus novemcinctus]|uniref:endogenous retrovirus group K member 7 Pro protein-like n=1 Tax=Dasypus novemcinctus TaxID=9361 RepID=UPI00265E5510|nr:endogenous retrovirus group K member 7 Pro protein-like [Dasypus novemcinctus]